MRSVKWIKTLVALGAFSASAFAANALETKKYDDAAFKAAQAAGAEIVVHVTAPWCPTCKAQHQALGEIGKNGDYAKVAVFDVDFDTQTDALKAFKANSQSTLIAFKGATETGRLVGATKAEQIETLVKSTMKK
ncbi:MAG: thioredoxin family protein [Hyphomicrobium sp.]